MGKAFLIALRNKSALVRLLSGSSEVLSQICAHRTVDRAGIKPVTFRFRGNHCNYCLGLIDWCQPHVHKPKNPDFLPTGAMKTREEHQDDWEVILLCQTFFLSPECRCSSFALKGLSSFKWTISLPIDLNTDLSSPVKRENKNVTIKPVVFSKESWQQSLSAIKCDVSFVKSEFARMCCSP